LKRSEEEIQKKVSQSSGFSQTPFRVFSIRENNWWVNRQEKKSSSGVNRRKAGKQEYQKGPQELLQDY
jgi:hypothetical protein